MKKALIISISGHNTLGGTQNYNRKLILLLQKMNYEVTEYNSHLLIDKVNEDLIDGVHYIENSSIPKHASNRLIEGIGYMKQAKVADYEILNLVNKNNFDLIIDSRQHPYSHNYKYGEDFIKNKNVIWVQHVSPKVYDGEHLTNKFFTIFTKLFLKNKNILYAHNNIVMYDKYNLDALDKNKIKSHVFYLIPLSHPISQEEPINFLERTVELAYIGRIVKFQKNIPFLIKAAKNITTKIDIWGSANSKMVKKIKTRMNYHGFIEQGKIDSVLKNVKFIVLCSKFEGFAYIIVQAISHGVIPIIIDTYPSAKYLSQFGFLFKSSIKPKDFASEINKILKINPEKLVELSQQNRVFFETDLTDDQFLKSWQKIIEDHSK